MTPADDYLFDPASAPDEEIVSMERALEQYRYVPAPLRARRPRWLRLAGRLTVLAAAAALLIAILPTLWFNRPVAPWTLADESSGVMVRGERDGRIGVGNVIATDSTGRARLRVGRAGDVYLSPGSEVEVTDTSERRHRLVLRRGEMHARIWAPARFFVVDTRWGSAVDLGCVYTLRVDDAGGSLEVYQGAVELARQSGPLYLAAGTGTELGGTASGIPWPVHSGSAFRATARAVATGDASGSQLDSLLAAAGVQETITLWNLLTRVGVPARERLTDRIGQLVPLSAELLARRGDVLALEPAALAAWEAELRPYWSSEPNTFWRRLLVRWRLAKPVALLQLPSRTE